MSQGIGIWYTCTALRYEGPAKSSVTNRLPWFYPRYILKCFTALECCVEQLKIPIYFVQIAFQLTELFQIEIDAIICILTNLLVTIRNDQAKDGQESTFYMTMPPLISVRLLSLFSASEKVKVLNHPPYSPDLSPCDFFLFPRLKKMLSGNKYISWQRYFSVSPTDTKRRLFICFSRLGKKVTKMFFSKGRIIWRFVIKICLIKCSTEVIRTQWQNFLQDPRTSCLL